MIWPMNISQIIQGATDIQRRLAAQKTAEERAAADAATEAAHARARTVVWLIADPAPLGYRRLCSGDLTVGKVFVVVEDVTDQLMVGDAIVTKSATVTRWTLAELSPYARKQMARYGTTHRVFVEFDVDGEPDIRELSSMTEVNHTDAFWVVV